MRDGIPLEDLFNDVLGKAMQGTGLTVPSAAELVGVSAGAVEAVLEGKLDLAIAGRLAREIGLHEAALVDLAGGSWTPAPQEIEGLAMFNTPYPGMTVNAYVVWDPVSKDAAVFDTGTDASLLMALVTDSGLTVKEIFLTHTHRDHILDLDTLRAALPEVPVRVGRKEPLDDCLPVDDGDCFQVGNLSIEARLTNGHSIGGISYAIDGLPSPIAVVGDALFAGSMGGGMVSWSQALESNRLKLFTLAEDTVICPGHGPMSTIGEEKLYNPCFPEYKGANSGN